MAEPKDWYPDTNPTRSHIYVGFDPSFNIQNGENTLEFTQIARDSLSMWDPLTPSRFICIRSHIYLMQVILVVENAGIQNANISIRCTPAADPVTPYLIYDRLLGSVPTNGRIEFGTGAQLERDDYLELFLTCTYILGNPQCGSNLLHAGVKFSELA